MHLVLTSPPFWTLKEYRKGRGQLGFVADYDDFLAALDEVWARRFDALVLGLPYTISNRHGLPFTSVLVKPNDLKMYRELEFVASTWKGRLPASINARTTIYPTPIANSTSAIVTLLHKPDFLREY